MDNEKTKVVTYRRDLLLRDQKCANCGVTLKRGTVSFLACTEGRPVAPHCPLCIAAGVSTEGVEIHGFK